MPSTEIKTTKAEIFEALEPLLRTMPSKGKVEDRMEGYFIALAGFSRSEIDAGVRRFLSGHASGVKSEFVPPPPQMAQIARAAAELAVRPEPETGPQLTRYRPPRSKIIEYGCSKEAARRMVADGVVPKGSIWCPAPYGEDQSLGDLYGPDPGWQPGITRGPEPPLNWRPPVPELPAAPKPEEPKIHDYSLETDLQITPALLKALAEHDRDEQRFDHDHPEQEDLT